MTFRARLTLFFVGIVAAPLVVGAVVAANSARTQAIRDADGRLQVAAVTATDALRLERARVSRVASPAAALRAFQAESGTEIDGIRRDLRLDYLLVVRDGEVVRSSVDLPAGVEASAQEIAGGGLSDLAAERTLVIGGTDARVLAGRLWRTNIPSELGVGAGFVLGGRPVAGPDDAFTPSARPVSDGDRRVVCLCRFANGTTGLFLFTSARSEGLTAWLRWPQVLLVALGLGVLVGIAYLLARLLTRPIARLAEEVAAVARGEPDVQPVVDEGAGRELYQVATTLRTVSQELTGSRGELERTRGRLAAAERLTLIDPLTGVWNRRYLERAMREHVKRFERFDSTFGLLVIDIDWFKRINDEHGHAVGDAVLTEVAHTMDGSIRADIDVMTRFGGEEFVVVLPETDAVGSFVAAEKIRELVADSRFESDGASIQVTVSVGVAACPADAVDADHAARGGGRRPVPGQDRRAEPHRDGVGAAGAAPFLIRSVGVLRLAARRASTSPCRPAGTRAGPRGARPSHRRAGGSRAPR